MRKPEKLGRSEKEEKGKRFNKLKNFLENKIASPRRRGEKELEDIDYRPPLSPEEEKKHAFKKYLLRLGLDQNDLKGKKILDLGCGPGGFVKECLDQGLAEAYGIDLRMRPEDIDKKYKNHFFKGSFEGELPLKDLDLIVSHGAVEICPGQDPKKTLTHALRSVKEGGEIRISPIFKTLYGSSEKDYKDCQIIKEKWQEILNDLVSQGLIEYEFKPTQIIFLAEEGKLEVNPNLPHTSLVEALILKKRVEANEGEGENIRQLDEARKEADEAFEEEEKE